MKVSFELDFGFFKIHFEDLKLKGIRKNKKEKTILFLPDTNAEFKAFEIRKARKLQDYIK